MKRSGTAKFPHSVQLFKFCQRILMHQKGGKIHDQEVGAILNFNPSDCSHWKRGEKNVRSVFALAKLSETLGIEPTLIHEVASSEVGLDEAFFEYIEAEQFKKANDQYRALAPNDRLAIRNRILAFVKMLHDQAEFRTPPLYIPEVMRFFSFIGTQPMEMVDKLSRILRIKAGKYAIHYRRGDLKPQTRMSMVKDLARILFEAERERFPELGPYQEQTAVFEQVFFSASLLVPSHMLMEELAKIDVRKNLIADLSTLFWVPKSLLGYQLQDLIRSGSGAQKSAPELSRPATQNLSSIA